MKSIVAIAALLLAGPVQAQTIYPNLAAVRFCELRSAGVSYSDAISTAIRENINRHDVAPLGMFNGKAYDSNVILFGNAIVRLCPWAANR